MKNRRTRTTVLSLVIGLLAATGTAPADAATRHLVATHVVAHATPATVLTSSTLVVAGTVTPVVPGSKVVLQRLVVKQWQSLATRTVGKTGAFSFSVKAFAAPASWSLRVARPATATSTAAVSHTLAVRVTRTAYVVSTTLVSPPTSGVPVVVTGSVSPAAKGTVMVQQLVGSTWAKVATGKLTASHFSISVVLPPGSHRLRVIKAFSAKVAGGVGAAGSVTVPPGAVPPGPPAVATTTLGSATVGVAYSLTLAASGGVAPYSWSAHGLPPGLVLSTAGVVSGLPLKVGASSVAVTVTDSRGIAAGVTLALQTVARAGVPKAWGVNGDAFGNGTSNGSSPTAVTVNGLTDVTQVAIGAYSAIALASDGAVWAWGLNLYGEFGNATMTASAVPVKIAGLAGITAVAVGEQASYFLKSDGTVWASGYNNVGQLGDSTTSSAMSPVRVGSLTGAVAIAAGAETGYALLGNGTVWDWGFGGNGRLGNGTTATSTAPVPVSTLTGVVAISAGATTSYAVRSDGTAWAWGDNGQGQLGDGTSGDTSTPVQVSGLADVTSIVGGQLSGYALTSDGSVWAWGDNAYGELGNNTPTGTYYGPVRVVGLAGVTAIGAGFAAAYAVLPGGYVASWGRNDEGQLGNASTAGGMVAVPVLVLGVTGAFAVASGTESDTVFALTAG